MYSTLKRRGKGRFHIVSTWNTHVFVGTLVVAAYILKQKNIDFAIIPQHKYYIKFFVIQLQFTLKTALKMKFSIMDFFSKCDQIR